MRLKPTFRRWEGAIVTPGFFETFGAPLLEGRDFTRAETGRGGDPVVIVNRSFVERHMPGESVVGRLIRTGRRDSEEPWLRIVAWRPTFSRAWAASATDSGSPR